MRKTILLTLCPCQAKFLGWVAAGRRCALRLGMALALLAAVVLLSGTPGQADTVSTYLGSAANFAMLGLNNGTVIVNSGHNVTGDFGYSNGVVSNTNQKVDSFTGTAYVHSGATFSYTAATFAPSGGIQTGPLVDALLNQANVDAASGKLLLDGLSATQTLSAINDTSQTVNSSGAGAVNMIFLPSLLMNSDTLTLNGLGGGDIFIFKVTDTGPGVFKFSQSQVVLNGTDAAHVLFYLPNPADGVLVNKDSSVFQGTLFAPTGSVEYHNPVQFTGSIVALNVNLHSDFNLDGPQVPVPPSVLLLGTGLLGLVGLRWRRRKTNV